MEDVLEVHHRPYDADCPVVCLGETSKQLVAETRVPVAAKPGQVARYDYEYERNGTANLFMMFAPLASWRHVELTDRRDCPENRGDDDKGVTIGRLNCRVGIAEGLGFAVGWNRRLWSIPKFRRVGDQPA